MPMNPEKPIKKRTATIEYIGGFRYQITLLENGLGQCFAYVEDYMDIGPVCESWIEYAKVSPRASLV